MAVEVAAPAVPHNVELSDDELRLALALAHVRPCGQSPLVDARGEFLTPATEPFADRDVENLFRKGLLAIAPQPELKPEWQQVVAVLANPLWDLSLILSQHHVINYDRYYAGGALTADALVYYRAAADDMGHHVSFPYGPRYLFDLLDQALGFAQPAMDAETSAELSYKEYVALLAFLDALRTRTLENMLDRDPEAVGDVALDDIRAALQQGLKGSDSRWLVSLGHMVSPFPFDVTAEELEGLMDALVMRGHVEAAGPRRWAAAAPTQEMVDSMLVVPSFAAFELTFIKSADVFEINYFAAIRGIEAIWLFDFYELATAFPRVSVATVAGDELSGMLGGLVEESHVKSDGALRSRRTVESRSPQDGTRLPSPPTLRGLKVPPTMTRLRPGMAAPLPYPAESAPAEKEMDERRGTLTPGPSEVAPAVEGPVASRVSATKPDAVLTDPPVAESLSQRADRSQPFERPCPFCGLPILSNKKFCRHCGKEVPTVEASAPDASSQTPASAGRRAGDGPDIGSPSPAKDRGAAPLSSLPPAEVAASSRSAQGDAAAEAGASLSEAPLATPNAADPLAWLRSSLPPMPDSAAAAFSSASAAPAPASEEGRISAAAPSPLPTPPPLPPPQQSGTQPGNEMAQASQAPAVAVACCPACGFPMAESARFCGHCGVNVAALRERTCPRCKGRLAPNARFCAFCGQSVT